MTIDQLAAHVEDFSRPAAGAYLAGHSLGLMSKSARCSASAALSQWEQLGVQGWSDPAANWFWLAENVAKKLATIVGANPDSLTVIGTTTSNIHQMLATFCGHDFGDRKLLIDGAAFPTDRYALASVLRLLDSNEQRLLTVAPADDGLLSEDSIIAALQSDVGMVLLPTVVYQTGQLLDVKRIVNEAHARGILIGLDCSHSAGVVDHHLDDIAPDFAVFSTYKYLNGGPGSMAGLYVHRRHADRIPGLAGWFGCDKSVQFQLQQDFAPAADAGRFQIGTPHILSLAGLCGALDVHTEAGMPRIRRKSLALTQLLMDAADQRLAQFGVTIITPRDPHRRGGHVTLKVEHAASISRALRDVGVIADYRPPDLIRFGPSPLSTTFEDCEHAMNEFETILKNGKYHSDEREELVT